MTPPDQKSASPPALRAVRNESKCPVCGRPMDARYRPFCTKRCADVDLGRWLKEGYRVPTEEMPGEGEVLPVEDDTGAGPTGHRR